MQPIGPTIIRTLTIANGASVSDTMNLGDGRALAVQLPSAWTAADLYVEVSTDEGANWSPMFDVLGIEYPIKAAASRFVVLPLQDFLGISYMRLASGPSTGRVNQGAARSIKVVVGA